MIGNVCLARPLSSPRKAHVSNAAKREKAMRGTLDVRLVTGTVRAVRSSLHRKNLASSVAKKGRATQQQTLVAKPAIGTVQDVEQ